MTRVVVTSVGVIGPTATTWPGFVEALREGRAGGGPVTLFDASAFPTRIAAEVQGFDPAAALGEALRRCEGLACDVAPEEDRKTALGVAAALQCADAAAESAWGGRRLGVHLGTGLSSVTQAEVEAELAPWLDGEGRFDAAGYGAAAAGLASSAPWRHLTDEANRLILAALGASGPTTSNFSACAASAQAIGRAFLDIRSGRVVRALAGGMDSMVHPFGMISFMRLGALSTRNEAPLGASRPFDRARDGFLLGEGAAVLLLEEATAAAARGAEILAEIVGFGTSIDAHLITAPHPEGRGARLAMERALRDAGLEAGAIDYINAHGTGTPLNDSTESLAIASLWRGRGLEPPQVSSTKSMTGHLIAAAGAIEAAACVAALREGFLPPSIHIEALDPACEVPVVEATRGVPADVRYAMSNSFGFGGQNASLIFKRWEG